MKYINICQKSQNFLHSTFCQFLPTSFASKFSDLFTCINFMFPTFTNFLNQNWDLWTVKKSNFESFQKAILYSLPFVGLSMKYFYTILLPLLVSLANISQTWSFFIRAYFSSHFLANKKVLSNKNDSFFNVGNFLESLQVLNFKLQIRPDPPCN